MLDPFLGRGTTSVVAKRLERNFIGIEIVEEHALLAERRLQISDEDPDIQGYSEEIFRERSASCAVNQRAKRKTGGTGREKSLL